jgi:hypothetical protein
VHRELFPRYTGAVFDAITPAVVAADLTASHLLESERAARLVEQKAIDPGLPGLDEVLDAVLRATFGASAASPYEAEIKRAVERVVVDRLLSLALQARMPQVRALASHRLRELAGGLESQVASADRAQAAHARLLAEDVTRMLARPAPPAAPVTAPAAPPGAPIGEPALDWLRRIEPPCAWER